MSATLERTELQTKVYNLGLKLNKFREELEELSRTTAARLLEGEDVSELIKQKIMLQEEIRLCEAVITGGEKRINDLGECCKTPLIQV